jgi:hypothetical protein
MSGSKRTWTPTTPTNTCDQLSFRSSINSPQPSVISGLNKGDILKVVLQTIPQTAVVVEHQGTTAGALVGTKVNSLINCLQNGYQFVAEVLEVAGGRCTVEVRPA